MLMDPTVKPLAEDDIRVINQRKASKQRRAQKRQLVGDEEETVVRKKPKDPPRPEPLLRLFQEVHRKPSARLNSRLR